VFPLWEKRGRGLCDAGGGKVELMPKWIAAKQIDVAKAAYVNVPVEFEL